MSWNYRVFRDVDSTGLPQYEIIEVFYTKDDRIRGWTNCEPTVWQTYDDLQGTIKRLLPLALTLPILVRKEKDSDILVESPINH